MKKYKKSKSDLSEPLCRGERVVVERTSYPLAIFVCEREKERKRELWYSLQLGQSGKRKKRKEEKKKEKERELWYLLEFGGNGREKREKKEKKKRVRVLVWRRKKRWKKKKRKKRRNCMDEKKNKGEKKRIRN